MFGNILTFLLRVWAIFVVAIRRLFSQRGLALATILGQKIMTLCNGHPLPLCFVMSARSMG